MSAINETRHMSAVHENENYRSEFTIQDGRLISYRGSEQHVIIPDTVQVLGDNVFQSHSISSIEIPSSVTKIGRYAFQNCKYIKSIILPNKIASIGDYAFSGCESLEEIIVPASVKIGRAHV